MFAHILVPLDGSVRAEEALPVAARIARASGGSIHPLEVVSPPIDYGGGYATAPLLSEQLIESETTAATDYLQTIVALPVLASRLRSVLARINPYIPADTLEEVIQKITRTDTPNLFENNRRFHKQITDGVDVEYHARDGRIIHDKAWLIDFSDPGNNDWLAVNQFTVLENKNNRRCDVVIFVNGLPLGVIELKNPGDENATIRGAFNQLQTYKKDIPGIFPYNEILVISDGLEARAGTLTADWERFMP